MTIREVIRRFGPATAKAVAEQKVAANRVTSWVASSTQVGIKIGVPEQPLTHLPLRSSHKQPHEDENTQ
jgi:hypothetical protein